MRRKRRGIFEFNGVDFKEARTVFEDPFALTILDDPHWGRRGTLNYCWIVAIVASIVGSTAQPRPRLQRGFSMSQNARQERQAKDDQMRPEYDSSQGLCGVHAYRFSKLSSDQALIFGEVGSFAKNEISGFGESSDRRASM
jgi:hypothetical protein